MNTISHVIAGESNVVSPLEIIAEGSSPSQSLSEKFVPPRRPVSTLKREWTATELREQEALGFPKQQENTEVLLPELKQRVMARIYYFS